MSDVVIAGRGHCCDPFAVLKQEIDMAITIAMNARNIAEEALASTGAGASDNNPLPLDDTASPGTAMEWSRSDHVHPNTGLLEPDDVIAGDNIEVTDNGDGTVTIALKADQVRVGNTVLTGNVTITGNITQNGSAYETHAEKVYTTNDYVIMREGATGALGSGDYSGFQVKLYDGSNDGRLVIDNTGTARVGDVGDEQPLMTRDESADLTDGDSLIWDSANSKAITAAIPSAISTALAGKENTITVTRPANRVHNGTGITISQSSYTKYGKLIIFGIEFATSSPISTGSILLTFDDKPVIDEWLPISSATDDKNYSGRIDTSGNLIATESFPNGVYCIMRGTYYTNS